MRPIQFIGFILFLNSISYKSALGEITHLPTVPPIKVGDKIYYIETFAPANWYRAGQFCRRHHMHLASITNQDENDALGKAIDTFSLSGYKLWTSGNDWYQPKSFVWQSTGDSFTFTNWRPDQPDNNVLGNETQHCTTIDNLKISGGWDDEYCSNEYYFVCEIV